jgi:diguanylate cyclase (GGDEF)-like protein
MTLDPLTLMAMGSFATVIGGVLLFAAWTQIREPSLLWWAGSSFVNSIGISLFVYSLASGGGWVMPLAAGLNALSPVLAWSGVRIFKGRKPGMLWLIAGPTAWLMSGAIGAGQGSPAPATFVSFAIWVAYLTAAAVELLTIRDERLPARWPLVGLLGLHAFTFLGGAVDTLTGALPSGPLPVFSTWFSIVHFETLIYAFGTATFMVLICKQRSEHRHITAARNDSLTGIYNRGAFLEAAARIMARSHMQGTPGSVIMFDLDRFKWINDTFGHSDGDQVIRTFADVTRDVLRPSDLFGRYGGEEFVVLLPGMTIDAAYVIAERIRHAFVDSAGGGGDRPGATVSGGVAMAEPGESIESVLRAADHCLYRAKRLGRNRIERADSPDAHIARIA